MLGVKNKAQRYPICLTCLEVMREVDKTTPASTCLPYYCPRCDARRGPVKVWGKDRIAELIRRIAKNNNLRPV